MKISEWIRKWQLLGIPPECSELSEYERTSLAFWSGWLLGNSLTSINMDERRSMALRAAIFIEEQK